MTAAAQSSAVHTGPVHTETMQKPDIKTKVLTPRRSTDLALPDRMPQSTIRVVPPTRVRASVAWLMFIGFGLLGSLVVWASVSTLHSAVVASGLFRVVGDRLVVQHLEGGIINEILVKEGDVVQQGQTLLTLDAAAPRAAVDMLTNRLVSALSTDARLQAEFDQSTSLPVSEELASLLPLNRSFTAMLKAQTDLLASNSQIYDGQIDILNDRISQLTQQKAGVDVRVKTHETQLDLLREEIGTRNALLDRGLTTKSQVLSLLSNEAGLEGNIGVAQSQLQQIYQQIAEVEARKLQLRHDRLQAIAEDRQKINEDIFDIRQQLATAQDVVDRLVIRAPKDGRIVGLGINTQGSVIASGQKLMEIVPAETGYVIEVRLNPNDVNQVAEGGTARVRLTAYNARTTPLIDATVTALSADSLVGEMSGAPYFRAEVALNAAQVAALPDVEIVPGMPAQVMIATGTRTVTDYLIGPLVAGYDRALAESE